MKTVLTSMVLMTLIGLSQTAHAVDLELSLGHTQFQKTENGIWWQNGSTADGFSDQMDLSSQSFSIGVTDRFSNGLRWRAAFTRLGQVSGIAKATPQDSQYNGVDGCVGPCPAMNTFKTEASVRGFELTVAPEWSIGNNTVVFVEGGLFVYNVRFDAYVWGNDPTHVWTDKYDQWNATPMFGVGIDHKGAQIVARFYRPEAFNPGPNNTPNHAGGYVMNLAVRYRF